MPTEPGTVYAAAALLAFAAAVYLCYLYLSS